MKINWKVRFQNKVWLSSLIALVLSTIYNILDMFNITPAITQNQILDIVSQILMILGFLGVVVDPTTQGFNDSNRAMSYEKPWVDSTPDTMGPNE